ncbi:MAG: HEAT repeat domain-containing protein [Candidatus Woesearchaeota archaeon]
MEYTLTAQNKMNGITERIDAITLAGRKKEPNACKILAGIIKDENDALEARVHAVRAVCNLDKHEAYPVLLEAFQNANKDIRLEAIASAYLLNDSRILFPLVNIYNQLSIDNEEYSIERYAIIRALGTLEDPRATEFLESLCASKDNNAARLAREALNACKFASEMLYTFNGTESQRNEAARKDLGRAIWSKQDLKEAISMIKDEQKNGAYYAAYVILPIDKDIPFGKGKGSYLVLAPRRSEHVCVAKGQDVLGAGEIGINKKTLEVEYVDNHSGGYLPSKTSFKWVKNALDGARIKCSLKEFSANYPPGGYFTEEFLSQQPLYKKN